MVSKHKKLFRGVAIGVLYICTARILYLIISDPLGVHVDIIIPSLAVSAGFIALASPSKKHNTY